MEDIKIQKAKSHWKHRRSRSTSNLIGATVGVLTDSDDSGKEGDSDDAQRSFARLSLQTGRPSGSRSFRVKPIQTINPPNIESDSVNEFLCGGAADVPPHLKVTQRTSKRRRRYKRMAIDYTEVADLDVFKEPYQARGAGAVNESVSGGGNPTPSTSSGISHSNSHKPHRKKSEPNFLPFEIDIGKRKRIGRDKTAEGVPFPIPSCSSDFRSMIGMGMELMNMDVENEDELMKTDDDDEASSVSSDSGSVAPSCDDGQEGDDEQSDWVGDEWKDDLVESERQALLMRRLRDYVPSREIRAGKRRVHPEKPPFSMRTYANEQVSKFIQDPAQSQLKLHPMRRDERVQLSHIASLYSLQLHSDETGGYPILTKTSNTTQVNAANCDKIFSKTNPSEQILMESESDSKRIKSDNPV